MKKIYKLLHSVVFIVCLIISILNIGFVTKTDYDIVQAEEMLKEIYKPLEDFNKSLIVTQNEKILLVPENINNQEDFNKLFNNRISDLEVKDFYELLIINENQKLYVDSSKYIPSIYSEGAKVTKAYIKKRTYLLPFHKPKYEETLIIKETWLGNVPHNKRTNKFVKNQNGEWVLNVCNGVQSCGFVDVNDNPWHLKRNNDKN